MRWRGLEHMPEWYERLTLNGEEQLAPQRAELLSDLQGDVLEIGVGVGYNLRFYGPHVRLTALDIDLANVQFAARKPQAEAVNLLTASADALPFADQSFDHLVATLVLCSVDSQVGTLHEFARVLRPGGSVRLIDHTLSGHWPIDMVLHAVEKPWMWFTGGCHPNRATVAQLQALGWQFSLHKARAANIMHVMIVHPPGA